LEVHAAPTGLAEIAAPPAPGEEQPPLAPDEVTILGQLDATYLVVQHGRDLLLVDQHRAAERVIFDRLMAQPRRLARQLLAVPVTLELAPDEAAAVEDYREALGEMGFEVEPFGGSSYLLRSVPAQLTHSNPEEVVGGMIAELAQWQSSDELGERREAMLASVACHAAIKAGQRLSPPEMQKLVADLLATQTPAVCPHGDPVIVTMEGALIDRKFGRS
ncbi:unnamed protein product, partial [marine sediment metagenome]